MPQARNDTDYVHIEQTLTYEILFDSVEDGTEPTQRP